MLALPQIALTSYFLPDDGPPAHARFLELLHAPGETWLAAYGFTDAAMLQQLETADAAGVPLHLLLDLTQAGGTAERAALRALTLSRGDVTLSTAGPRSKRTSQIMHSKCMVVEAPDGEPWCWTGSVNFSESGWLQANQALLFRSRAWADAFIAWFTATRTWALQHVRQGPGALPKGA